jgi:hypothetical protein
MLRLSSSSLVALFALVSAAGCDLDTVSGVEGEGEEGEGEGEGEEGEGEGEGEEGEGEGEGEPLADFSFFVTSMVALIDLSENPEGFGGDLRFGETGPGAGLRGADKICATIAEQSMPGSGAKQWRAFLSATDGGDGNVVHAIDRIGNGPWYDRLGRLFANDAAELMFDRPQNADPAIKNDFPNELGVPNHDADLNGVSNADDNHDMLTGSDEAGQLYSSTATCESWTSSRGDSGRPRVGHSWPRSGGPGGGGGGGGPGGNNGANWMSALDESGCAPGINLIESGPPDFSQDTVGSGGGYGGFYCFALTR